jgi:hypothetical protein
MAGAVSDVTRHDLVETDARADFIFCHGCATEHVAGLHAVDDSVVGLFVPESAEEDKTVSPRGQRFEAGTEFHGGALAFRPPVLRVKPHSGEGDKGSGGGIARRAIGSGPCGSHAIEQGKGEGCTEATQRVSSANEPLVSLDIHGGVLV